MNKNTLLTVALLTVVTAVSIFIVVAIFGNKDSGPSINDRIITGITDSNPQFLQDNKPAIDVASISSFDNGWHIATIKSLRVHENIVPVKVVIFESSGALKIIAGPDTHFTETELLDRNVPDSVILELLKS